MSILDVLDELASTRSKLEKINILEKHKDYPNLKEVFVAAYDPMISYYIKNLQEHVSSPNVQLNGWVDVFSVLNRLNNRQVTGHKAKDEMKEVLQNVSPETSEVVGRILKHDLRIGCAGNTANKVWPNLIEKYPCMLCESFSEKNLAKITYPAIVQSKSDGMRVNFVVKDGAVEVFGRSGKPIDLLGTMDETVLNLMIFLGESSGVIDGELMVVGDNGVEERSIGNGILNKAVKGTISKEEASNVVATVWDFISLDEFSTAKNAKGIKPYRKRYSEIESAVNDIEPSDVFISDSMWVVNLEEAKHFYKEQLAKGLEGAVLKNVDSVWENRRSREQVKLKVEHDVELVVVGMNEGTGRLKNNLGSLECQSSDGGLCVNVSGFTDEQRKAFWAVDATGTIITVRSNDYQTSDSKSTLSLFLPRFIEERLDKDTANSTQEIKDGFDVVYNRNQS